MGKDLEVVEAERLKEQQEVVTEYLMGYSMKQIADRSAIPYSRVKGHITEWRQYAQNHPAIRARAKESLVGADEHYQRIIRELWRAHSDADQDDETAMATVAKTKAAVLKSIADVEKLRVDMLHRAGLLENDELAAEVIETQRKQDILVGILRDVTNHCSQCRTEVARRLSMANDEVEVVQVNVGL